MFDQSRYTTEFYAYVCICIVIYVLSIHYFLKNECKYCKKVFMVFYFKFESFFYI